MDKDNGFIWEGVLPLVEKLREVVKNLAIKRVQLTEQGKKLTAKVGRETKTD